MFLACRYLASFSKVGDQGGSQVFPDICLQFDPDGRRCCSVDFLDMDNWSSSHIVSDEITDIVHFDAWFYFLG